MAQILRAVERIGQLALLIFGHGIDREIAPAQVVFECHIRRGVDFKTFITMSRLALSTRQRIFFFRDRMQKHRKIRAHGLEALRHHFIRRGADDNIVPVLNRQAEKFVAHRATDEINFHD